MAIWINADVGESYYHWQMGDDEALIPLLDSVNVACGFHAGDPLTLKNTLVLAKSAGVKVGAHPGYADIAGFGRRHLPFAAQQIQADLTYQLGAFQTMAGLVGVEVDYVKPHGALYKDMLQNQDLYEIFLQVIKNLFATPLVMLPDIPQHPYLHYWAQQYGVGVIFEGFLDRGYAANGHLLPRNHAQGLILDVAAWKARIEHYQLQGELIAVEQQPLKMRVDSWCVHGDSPGVVAGLATLRQALTQMG